MHIARNKQGKLRVDMNVTEGLASCLRFSFALSYVLKPEGTPNFSKRKKKIGF